MFTHRITAVPLALCLSVAALVPASAVAESRSPAPAATAAQHQERQRAALLRQYITEQRYRHADQHLSQQRDYQSAVGQGASNRGGARGHGLEQQQGDLAVGGLVQGGGVGSELPDGSSSFQFAPQSNTLTVGQDNYAPVQLSNIAASNGAVHIGDIYQGNMYGSQIGNNQEGRQLGDSSNQQINDQDQRAASDSGSQDRVSN
ncbi:hypothetical protein [Marinobacterium jannaschii]|uniref:hypothetical protein n=1 Tax=Marinobacterium jannaschii TaxID=64970 RepID=UPI000482EC82|nr:hypothetical protein [Marinobacterium jannaschii]